MIQRIEVAGARFLAQQCGDVPSAVLIHGFGSDLYTWDYLVGAFGDQIATLCYDLRGFGGTEATPGQAYSHTEDLRCILDSLKLTTVDLVGVSMGGSIAVNFALDYPDRVRKLVLISPGLLNLLPGTFQKTKACFVTDGNRSLFHSGIFRLRGI